jgi:dolichyl-phosphate mannosyltransferase polypeptide 2 regulatory subunit
MIEDKILGSIFMAISVLSFLYYTTWILILPFVDIGHRLHAYFPDQYYAVSIPLTLLVLGITGITSLIALVLIKSAPKTPLKKTQ